MVDIGVAVADRRACVDERLLTTRCQLLDNTCDSGCRGVQTVGITTKPCRKFGGCRSKFNEQPGNCVCFKFDSVEVSGSV